MPNIILQTNYKPEIAEHGLKLNTSCTLSEYYIGSL